MASQGWSSLSLLVATLLGSSLVVASGCVFNNFIDRDIDEKMARTKKRALVTGKVSSFNALVFATILGLAGFILLAYFTNLLTVLVGLIGLFFYVVVYGYFKRTSVHGTVVGSLSGSIPPVAGYTAVSNQFDVGAVLLFVILAMWQMPHFYSIAMYRLEDYMNAGIPVLPAKHGMRATKIQIMIYITIFMLTTTGLTIFGYTGYAYLIVMLVLGALWLRLGLKGFNAQDDAKWARRMFGFSLLVINGWCAIIVLDSLTDVV